MKKTKWTFCKSINTITKRSIISPYNKKKYTLHDCKDCYLTFFTPLIFEDIYETSTDGRYDDRHKGEIKISPSSDKACKYLKNKINNKKILDVGASNCVNYITLKKYFNIKNDKYYALELDKKALNVGKKAGVKNIIPYYFDKTILKKIKTKFDIIIATEVLEHQVDPKDFIETGFEMLKKGGLFVITIPNKDRFFMKQREMPTDVPPHHFLKLNKKFFKKNFSDKIIHLEDFHNRQSTTKSTAESLSASFVNNKKLWYLFVPTIPLIRIGQLMDKIIGDRLLIVLKK